MKTLFIRTEILDPSVSTNDYFSIIKNNWSNLPNGNYFQKVASINNAVAIVYKENLNHGAILLIGYTIHNNPIYAILSNGTWYKF